jgi:Metal-sensitive transcriptional repressor
MRSTSWPNGMTLGREQLSQRLASPALHAHATAADAEALCPSLGAYTLQGYSLRTKGLGRWRMPGYAGDKEQVLTRLRRIEGQVRGLQRLVDDDAY